MIEESKNLTKFHKDYYKKDNFIFINPTVLNVSVFGEQALAYLPVDTGIEIECSVKSGYSKSLWDEIPGLIENNSTSGEQRLRIPPGMEGLNALYHICEVLNESFIKSNQGYHFHIDMTSCYHKITKDSVSYAQSWMLKELDTWQDKGDYNSRNVSFNSMSASWIRFQSGFKTMEIRVGRMTFNYKELVEMIVHAHYIGTYFRESLKISEYLTYVEDIKREKKTLESNNLVLKTAPSLIANRVVEVL